MKLYIAADHKGFTLKEKVKLWCEQNNIEINDLGAETLDNNDDYVDYAQKVSTSIIADTANTKGILICGSGVGMCIAANKIKGIRCGLCTTDLQTEAARADDDINILALAADFISEEEAKKMVQTFLKTPFKNQEKYVRRIEKIKIIENSA